MQIHCYGPQRVAVKQWLGQFFAGERLPMLRTFERADELHGARGGYLVEIVGHPKEMPPGVAEIVDAAGTFIRVLFDDSAYRARAERTLQANLRRKT